MVKAGNPFRTEAPAFIKEKVLNWLQRFNTFSFLDSCGLPDQPFDFMAGAGAASVFESSQPDVLETFRNYHKEKQGKWLFGHLGYGLKISGSFASSQTTDPLLFPDACFFEPEIVIQLKGGRLEIDAVDAAAVFEAILNTPVPATLTVAPVELQPRVNKAAYLQAIGALQQHIRRGDCYEINYCIEFFAEGATIDPVEIYRRLTEKSPVPFAGLYRLNDKWLICASPERFLKRTGNHIISQPIKGTLPRHAQDGALLAKERQDLRNSQKDRAENVMVVDLVRNDLSRICREGSVRVDELFGVYSFAQVHQMISTVSGVLIENANIPDILKATFPMGSMTGAPKISVMKLIEEFEQSKRGIYSGSIGYINPLGDFDLNVVIRSLMYNHSTNYLSCKVGSGITIYSEAEKEWEECLLKAKAIEEVLRG
ncbi:MAG: anthranilate synthase component I family protein [Niabella sp.]|nr:anthranilate synthase component I family protein [Niabella sp.]